MPRYFLWPPRVPFGLIDPRFRRETISEARGVRHTESREPVPRYHYRLERDTRLGSSRKPLPDAVVCGRVCCRYPAGVPLSFLDAVERGETLEVRRRKKVIARIEPVSEDVPPEWSDLLERLNALYPDGACTPSASDVLYGDRD